MKNIKTIIQAVVLLIAIGGTTACVPTEFKGLPQRTAAIETRLNEIDARQAALEKKLSELQDSSGKRMAGLGADFDSLAAQVRELRGLMDDLTYQVNNPTGNQQQGSVSSDVDSKIALLERKLAAIEDLLGASPNLAETPPPTPPPANGQVQPAGPDEASIYKKAYDLYTAGSYDESREAFESFLTKFPNSQFADKAKFWIGECYYQKNDWTNAAKNYARVFQDHPKSAKVPDAYYKLGMSFWRLGKKDAAVAALQKVVKEYPKSYVAPLAKRKLDSLTTTVAPQ